MSGRRQHAALSRTAEILLFLLFLALAAGFFIGVDLLEKKNRKAEPIGDPDAVRWSNAVEIGGALYARKPNLTSILVMGIDRDEMTEQAGSRNGGQADFLELIVLNETDKTVSRIVIDRDTITSISVPSITGNRLRQRMERISLSHGFGNGREQSCELTVDAAKRLLDGAPINYYISLAMNSLPVVNDLLGGVTVTVEDDLSSVSPRLTKGATLTLTSEEAYLYVRSRMTVGEGTNESRMRRQQGYIQAASELMVQKFATGTAFCEELYEALLPYMITDLPKGRLVNEAYAASSYTRLPEYNPKGTHMVDKDGFMQFIVDTDDLQRIILEVFYDKL